MASAAIAIRSSPEWCTTSGHIQKRRCRPESSDSLLRVTARATTGESRLLWSNQVDATASGTSPIHLQERVAVDIVSRMAQWLSSPRLRSTPKSFAHSCLELPTSQAALSVRPQ
jgi:hypothetical protein